jgi:hypothetical protein
VTTAQVMIYGPNGLPFLCACGAPATGAWNDWNGKPTWYCAADMPMQPLAAPYTTGHLGVCTCVTAWNAVTPPPPCPAHGQMRTMQVTC